MAEDTSKTGFRPDIQGLRGIAVVFVLLFHAEFDFLSGGYVGVDIFFVISGFLITGLLVREVDATGTVDFVMFYGRRFRRLLPALTVVLLCTTVIMWWSHAPLYVKQYASSGVATAAYLSNFWFAHLATDYLAENVGRNPLLHTWSLGVEEQFYLFWPLLVFFVFRWGRPETLRRRIVLAMLAVAAVSFVASIYLTSVNQPWAFFGSPTRAWEFAAGAVVAVWAPKRPAMPHVGLATGCAGLAAMLAAALLFSSETQFPGYAAALPVLGATLFILSGSWAADAGAARWISVAPMRFLGDISYSLYLWHWPVFMVLHDTVDDVGTIEAILALLLSVVLAWVTYVMVENPLRFSRLIRRGRWPSIAFGGGLTALSLLVILGVWLSAQMWLERDGQKAYAKAKKDLPEIYGMVCDTPLLGVEVKACEFGDPAGRLHVVLFGDSHAIQWSPAYRQLADANGFRLSVLTKSACPGAVFPQFSKRLNRPFRECDEWRENAFEWLDALRPDVIVTSNARYFGNEALAPSSPKLAQWGEGVAAMMQRLAAAAPAVVYLRDTPRLKQSAPQCLSRADWLGTDPAESCPIDHGTEVAERIFALEQAAAAPLANVATIDLSDVICPDTPCRPERDGLVLYRDTDHLTGDFVRHLAPVLWERMQAAFDNVRQVSRD